MERSVVGTEFYREGLSMEQNSIERDCRWNRIL